MGFVDHVLNFRHELKLLGLSLGAFLALIDIYVSTSTFYTTGLGTRAPWSVIWTIIGHQIAFAASLPIFEGLVEMRYHRLSFIVSSILFSVCSIVAGYQRSTTALTAWRAGKGLGAAGIFATAAVDQSRISQMAIRIAKIIGPLWAGLLGTACMEFLSWRWNYWLNGIFGTVALTCYLSGITLGDECFDNPVPAGSWISHLDVVGFVLISAALFVFALGSQVSAHLFWDEGWLLPAFGLLVVSIVLFSAFWLWERSSEQEYGFYKLLSPDSKTGIRNYSMFLSAGLAGFIWDTVLFSLVLGFQLVDTPPRTFAYYPGLWSAIRMLPLVVTSRVAVFFGSAVIKRGLLVSRSVSFTGNILMVFGLAMFTLSQGFPVGTFSTIQSFAIGFGFGLHLSAYDYIGLSTTSSPSHRAHPLSSMLPPLARSAPSTSPQLPGIEEESESSHDGELTEEDSDGDEDLESIHPLNPTDDNKPSQVKLECIRVTGGIFGISFVNMIFYYHCLEGDHCGKGAFVDSFAVIVPTVLLTALFTFSISFFLGKIRTVYSRDQN